MRTMRTNEIKKWSIDHVSLADIARQAETSKTLVSLVIRGERREGPKARRVIEVFLGHGCPPELLEPESEPNAESESNVDQEAAA